MLRARAVNNERFRFQKIFSEGDFMSSGVVVLPRGAEKPNKNSRACAMVFVVLRGRVRVTVHNASFNLGVGGQFYVPRGT